MKKSTVFMLFLGVALLAGCASTDVKALRSYVAGERLPRPGRIIVHDFVVSPEDLPRDSDVAGVFSPRATPLTAEEIRLERKLADILSRDLVQEILKLGMPAERAGGRPPQINDVLIKGEFVTIDEGSRAARMVIGFGVGASKLQTLAQAYQVTPAGLRRLKEMQLEAKSGKTPGMLVPIGVGAAAGRVATSAAVSGGLNVAKETIGGESLESAAKRTAGQIAAVLSRGFARWGWIPASKAK